MFWGLSHGLDLYEEYLISQKKKFAIENENKKQATEEASLKKEDEISNTVSSTCKNDLIGTEKDVVELNVLSDGNNEENLAKKTAETVEELCADISELHLNENKNNELNSQLNGNEEESPIGDSINDKTKSSSKTEKDENTFDLKAEKFVGTSGDESKANEGKLREEPSPKKPLNLNILIFGGGDPRHLIKTMAKLYTHRSNENGEPDHMPIVNFYVVDGCIEIVARNLALLSIVLENPETLILPSQVHLFMDIYGNSLMRPSTHHYLVGKSKTLIKMITDDDYLKALTPMININSLKYREKDGLINAFNFWLPKEGYDYNIQQYWESRVRTLLGQRYDYRDGAFDWDINMILKERNAQQLCSQEYRYWRETGIAFTFPEYEQCKPNKTLSCGLVRNGEKYRHRGYVGDIETGPFAAFGLTCNDKRMTKSAHGTNDYRATDVTERNLLELFYELKTASKYEHNQELSRKYGCVQLLMGKCITTNECDADAMITYDKPWLNIDGVHINLLSVDDILILQQPTKEWRDFFDVIFVGHNYNDFLKETFIDVLRVNGLFIMETKLLTLANKNKIAGFEQKLMNYAKETKLRPLINYNAINSKNSILKYKKI